jgi:hypothetical protein
MHSHMARDDRREGLRGGVGDEPAYLHSRRQAQGSGHQGELPPAGSQGQLTGAVERVVDSVGLVNEFNELVAWRGPF